MFQNETDKKIAYMTIKRHYIKMKLKYLRRLKIVKSITLRYFHHIIVIQSYFQKKKKQILFKKKLNIP